MTVDKQELRRLAEQSNQWSDEIGEQEWYCADDFYAPRISAPDSRFIAAASPSVVLELLDDLHSTESRLHEVASACATAEQERDRLREIAMRLVDLQNSGRGPIRTFTQWNDIANRARQVLGLEVRP